ncbi:hypothetical protein ACFQJD_15365 [Haloplanus sp. GCM10025708]|uniref:DUF7573 domain-containing protein n=1 Tax=Haloferacaceae TaxID=1644056 RepID=UPI00361A9BD3
MRDRSLDEFRSAASDGDADGDATDATPAVDATADATGNADSEAAGAGGDSNSEAAGAGGLASPATPTMRFVRDGACPACGASTAHLWNDGERFVCADCKEF